MLRLRVRDRVVEDRNEQRRAIVDAIADLRANVCVSTSEQNVVPTPRHLVSAPGEECVHCHRDVFVEQMPMTCAPASMKSV